MASRDEKMNEIELLGQIIDTCTANGAYGAEECPETLRSPPSEPVTEREIEVTMLAVGSIPWLFEPSNVAPCVPSYVTDNPWRFIAAP